MLTTNIWKYPINRSASEYGLFPVRVPKGSYPISARLQGGDDVIVVYFVVSDSKETEEHLIAVVGTGRPLEVPANAKFLNSVAQHPYVWHIFG